MIQKKKEKSRQITVVKTFGTSINISINNEFKFKLMADVQFRFTVQILSQLKLGKKQTNQNNVECIHFLRLVRIPPLIPTSPPSSAHLPPLLSS